jgi:hypothetical protein
MATSPPDQKILLTHLATATGRNIAILLQELHYVTKSQDKPVWRGSYDYWQRKHFPFWSVRTTEKTIRKAEEMGLVYSCFETGKGWSATKHTKSYGINYEAVAKAENQTGTLLLDDLPLGFSSSVATLFRQSPGLTLNDVFVLFEIRYWLAVEDKKYKSKQYERTNTHHNQYWDLKRLNDFQACLPFMCRRTIERSIKRLREAGYILTERTKLGTLAFTIVADKVNDIEGIADSLKVPTPPAPKLKPTKFYTDENSLRGYDLHYIVGAFNNISQMQGSDEYTELGLLTDGTAERNELVNKNLAILRGVVRKIGKQQLMTDLRSGDFTDTFADGDWEGYSDMIDDWLASTIKCFNCGQRYYEQEGCVCGSTEAIEWSFASG